MVRMACGVALVLAGLAASSVRAEEKPTPLSEMDVRLLSLGEAVATALEQGTVGQPSLLFPGVSLDTQVEASDLRPVKVLASRTPEGGILISRASNIPRAEWERDVNQVLLNVETAYWNLYGGYWQLWSREAGLRLAYETWKIVEEQYRSGRASCADVAQAQGQYELFRAQRLQALDQVLDYERQLRGIMNMQTYDGTRLVPADAPTLVLEQPDWNASLKEALANRPELQMDRQEVKWCQLRVFLVRGLRFLSDRGLDGGIGDSLCRWLNAPRREDKNVLRRLASNHYNDWAVGLRLTIPNGHRQAYANLRQAQLKSARAHLVLQDHELKVERFLGLEYRKLGLTYEQIKANRAQREAFATQLKTRARQYLAGRGTLDILLEAQRFWADALAQEYLAIVAYNNARCAFAFAKGSIQQHAHVVAQELPSGNGRVRAVDCEREGTSAEMCAERMEKVLEAILKAGGEEGHCPAAAATLPELLKDCPPLTEVPALPLGSGETGETVEPKTADFCPH
jgi:outer membrane protein TolC